MNDHAKHGALSEGRAVERAMKVQEVMLRAMARKITWYGTTEIHIVLDNLSAHKTKTVEEFLRQNPRVRFHFAPTYSSGLNQVELWFAKIQREVIDRGVFASVGSDPQTEALHPGLREISPPLPLDVHRPKAPHPY